MLEEIQNHGAPISTPFTKSLLILFRVAVQRKKLVAVVSFATITITTVAVALLPNLYTATAVILPPQQSSSAGAAMMAQLGTMGAMASMSSGGLAMKNPNDLQVALLKSNSVENAIVERFQLQSLYHRKYLSTTRKRWERSTKIENGLKDGLIRLSVTDRDPQRAAVLANGWVDEYKRFTATFAITEASQRKLFFERQLEEAQDELKRAEENLAQTQQTTGVIDVDSQARAMIASAAMLRAEVAAKRVEIQGIREFASEHNPDLMRDQQELSSLELQLASMNVEYDRPGGDLVAPKGKLTTAGLDYSRALKEVKYRQTIVELLSRQYEVARVDVAKQGPIVQVVDVAAVPDRPGSFYRVWILLGGLIGSLPLALLTAVAVEAFATVYTWRRSAGSWPSAIELAWSAGSR